MTIRLVALITIPTFVAVLFAGLRVSADMDRYVAFTRLERLLTLEKHTNALVHEAEAECDADAGYVASDVHNPSLRSGSERSALEKRRAEADAEVRYVRRAAAGIDGSYPDTVRNKVGSVLAWLDVLPQIRQVAIEKDVSLEVIISSYSQFDNAIIALNDSLADVSLDPQAEATARTLAALSRATEQASVEGAILHSVLYTGHFDKDLLLDLQNARAQTDSQLAIFQSNATLAQSDLYEKIVGPEDDRLERTRLDAVVGAQGNQNLVVPIASPSVARAWSSDVEARADRLRAVETDLADEAIQRSRKLATDAQHRAVLDGFVLGGVLIAVLAATSVVARSLVRPLRRLRAGALDVAGSRLPDLVRRLREPDVEQDVFEVEPIEVDSTDEIGEVARAFDEVHREAVRLASNEAMLRGNFNAMFVNLSRRSQSLIERQLRLIEDLEQSEQDSGRLDSLFKLDHLATRMRRNCENLLVLGGQEQARRWNKPVPLVDIVRASLSEVEQYERITLRIQDEVSVNGRTVNDLVHLVAELVENSTSFSPELTKVAVSGHLLSGGGAMLQISDNGVGMSPEELEQANWRLAEPPTIDVSVSRRMGLFVVGRLAKRHGIRVELRAALSGGLTAFVILPPNAIMQPTAQVRPERLDRLLGTPSTGTSAVQPPVVRGEIDRSPTEPFHAAPVPDTPGEPVNSQGGVALPKRKPVATSPPGHGTTPTALPRSGPSRPVGPPPGRPMGRPPGQPQDRHAEPSAQPPVRPERQPHPAGPTIGERRSAHQNNGSSPIFEAMQSEWFQRRRRGSMNQAESPSSSEWSSPGDEGWRAAETIRAPATGGQTSSGLPKRVPGGNRIPGSAGSAPAAEAPSAPRPAAHPPEAEAVRNRFASFQKGVRKGRAAIRPEDDERENQ